MRTPDIFSEQSQATWFDDTIPTNTTKKSSKVGVPLGGVPRFGIELNSQTYGTSLVTIWSGEPGHSLSPSTYGLNSRDIDFIASSPKNFEELGYANPTFLLGVTSTNVTYPIVTDGGDHSITSYGMLNGVIEPLSIRESAAMVSTYFPFEAHEIRGTLQSGNEAYAIGRGSELTVTIDEKPSGNVPYFDMFESEKVSGRPANGLFLFTTSVMKPFDDIENNKKVASKLSGEITGVVEVLNYRDMGEFTDSSYAFSSGYTYDYQCPIDSVAFGGMTYR